MIIIQKAMILFYEDTRSLLMYFLIMQGFLPGNRYSISLKLMIPSFIWTIKVFLSSFISLTENFWELFSFWIRLRRSVFEPLNFIWDMISSKIVFSFALFFHSTVLKSEIFHPCCAHNSLSLTNISIAIY